MSSISAGTTSSTALVATADTTGALQLKTNNGTTALTLDTSQNATFAGYANLPNTFGFKNRIINGAMVIDQRNAGASVTPTNAQFTVDRWRFFLSQTSKLTTQQNQGSVTPPAGFAKYIGITSSSAYTVGASEQFSLLTSFESSNIYDFAWGTANAKPVTLSFWVYSSLTGTFGGAVRNWAYTYSYPFTYTISSANTWTFITVNITAPTAGTWVMDASNNGAIELLFGLGTGATVSGTAGAWASANYQSATGATSVVGTNGATFYITGVQLEKGSTATSFDYRSYGTELALCQRYAWKYGGLGSDIFGAGPGLYADGNEIIFGPVMCPVLMRTTPSLTVYGTPIVKSNGGATTGWTVTIASATAQMPFVRMSKTSHGLTATVTTNLNFSSTSDYLIFSAEL